MNGSILSNTSPQNDQLRNRIGWICQSIRFAALTYALWELFLIIRLWLNGTMVAAHYGRWLHADLSGMEGWQRLSGFSVHFAIWLLLAAACYSAWQLFSGYLAGQIFTPEAASWLQRSAMLGIAAQLADMLTRPLVTLIVSTHLAAGNRMVGISFNPNDLLNLLLLAGLLALAYVFRVAAELAEDNSQIV